MEHLKLPPDITSWLELYSAMTLEAKRNNCNLDEVQDIAWYAHDETRRVQSYTYKMDYIKARAFEELYKPLDVSDIHYTGIVLARRCKNDCEKVIVDRIMEVLKKHVKGTGDVYPYNFYNLNEVKRKSEYGMVNDGWILPTKEDIEKLSEFNNQQEVKE